MAGLTGERMNPSKEINEKIERIVNYLKEKGCSKILLFGSIAEGKYIRNSDIDIAVSGMNTKDFLRAIANLPLIAKQQVDLVDLDDLPLKFRKSIEVSGVILYGN